jgi:spermidine synthase
MSATVDLSPAVDISAPSLRRTMTGVALVSCASLLLELGLTRLFSVVLFYHFAFLAISVALLGLGAGGVFAFLRRDRLQLWELRPLAYRLSLMEAISVLVVLEVVLHLPVSLDLTGWNFAKLSVMYLAAAVPFFFTGLMFSVIFARQRQQVTSIYGADLVGGSLACLAIVPLLNWIGGPNAILFSSVLLAAAAWVWAEQKKQTKIAFGLLIAFVLLIGLNFRGKLIDIVYAKGARRDQPWVLWARWNAISRVEVDQTGQSRYIVIDADASTAIMNVDPHRWDQTIAPSNLNLVEHQQGYNWKKDLMSAAPAVVNVLRPKGEFAIIGPGGGVDVLRAVANGSKDVTGIEINPLIATNIMRGAFADYAYHLYERPEVRMIVSDGRSFLRNSKEHYDVVQMTLVDTWASTAAGAFALSENNLYTVEAFEEYFNHLDPDGMIAITRWEFKRPREALRVVVQAMAALKKLGVKDPRKHFIVVSDGPLDVDGRPVLVLAKKSEFTREEEEAVRQHLKDNPRLHALILPSDLDAASGRALEAASTPFLEQIRGQLPKDYPFNVSPVSDNAPFFFFTLKTGDVIREILSGSGRGMDWRINLGVTVLFMVLIISLVAVVAFLVGPLWFSRAGQGSGNSVRMLYFIAIGLGYILVEITLIQRFVLFLGHPTYALTVVVFLMLLSSGAGSLLARRWLSRGQQAWLPLIFVVLGIAAYLIWLPGLLASLVGLGFGWKLLLSGMLIVPVAFAMGMPFPSGLRALAELDDQRVEWAWALNAAASVLGSVSAMVIAIHFGLTVTIFVAALAYLMALITLAAFRPNVLASA